MRLTLVAPQDSPLGDSDHDIDLGVSAISSEPIDIPGKRTKRAPEYKYEYRDTESLTTELNEWFTYSDNELLVTSYSTFDGDFGGLWKSTRLSAKDEYLVSLLAALQSQGRSRTHALMVLFYLATGVHREASTDSEQTAFIRKNANLLLRHGFLKPLYECIQQSISAIYSWSQDDLDSDFDECQTQRENLFLALSALYFIIVIRHDKDFGELLTEIDPNMISYFMEQISLFRLNYPEDMPWRNIFIITRRLILIILGDSGELEEAKIHARAMNGLPPESPSKDTVSTSPLDYHAFRQSITARYPAYEPAVESDVQEFALYMNSSAASSTDSLSSFASEFEYSTDPLPESSVHIATPAPSPPPFPAPQIKVKKSVFQTDRSLPLLYSQADDDYQVPFSIREAEEIFLQRMRTSLGIVQMWREREEFMKEERGWVDPNEPLAWKPNESMTDLKEREFNLIYEQRIQRVESIYRTVLPFLDQFVNTSLKFFLEMISPVKASIVFSRNLPRHFEANQYHSSHESLKTQLETERESEITLKSISGIFYLLLKWFRVSHVLKFEYLSQILFDNNICLNVIQILSGKEIDRFVDHISEVPELEFFAACRVLASGQPLPDRLQVGGSAKVEFEHKLRNRSTDESSLYNDEEEVLTAEAGIRNGTTGRREVTVYSRRNFYCLITLLKIFQKVVKDKTYRHLSLLNLKITNTLRRTLKISHYETRLYALKIIKGQVPFCPRKWRQTNMRVVTAIYLYCRQGLRDNWLSSNDGEVVNFEDSYPKEIALRAIIQFYNKRRYSEAVEALQYLNFQGGNDFFARELEGLVLEDSEM
ncbi:uncharacterized protein V1516DRAFT_664441 [Lipomyces oligophaga]|uniref:uncharacterized protein n=1 Tax=Lipomyces oligophaga TaxID=45792 RepID=UPI0034CEE7BE